jgi:hypothetical protein
VRDCSDIRRERKGNGNNLVDDAGLLHSGDKKKGGGEGFTHPFTRHRNDAPLGTGEEIGGRGRKHGEGSNNHKTPFDASYNTCIIRQTKPGFDGLLFLVRGDWIQNASLQLGGLNHFLSSVTQ